MSAWTGAARCPGDVFTRRGPFPYDGELEHVRYVPGPVAPDAPAVMVDVLRQLGVAFE